MDLPISKWLVNFIWNLLDWCFFLDIFVSGVLLLSILFVFFIFYIIYRDCHLDLY